MMASAAQPIRWVLAAFGLSVLALGAAYGSELFFGLRPCEMCYWQRVPYGAVIAFTLLALFLRKPAIQRVVLVLCAVAFAIGAGLAVFHAGVEWRWWEGPSACSGGIDGTMTAAELLAQIQDAAIVSCSDAAVRVLGLSMAGWNALYSLACLAITLYGLRLTVRRKP